MMSSRRKRIGRPAAGPGVEPLEGRVLLSPAPSTIAPPAALVQPADPPADAVPPGVGGPESPVEVPAPTAPPAKIGDIADEVPGLPKVPRVPNTPAPKANDGPKATDSPSTGVQDPAKPKQPKGDPGSNGQGHHPGEGHSSDAPPDPAPQPQSGGGDNPAPIASQPASIASQPAATASQPAAPTSQPAAPTSQPAPTASQPAAPTSQPSGPSATALGPVASLPSGAGLSLSVTPAVDLSVPAIPIKIVLPAVLSTIEPVVGLPVSETVAVPTPNPIARELTPAKVAPPPIAAVVPVAIIPAVSVAGTPVAAIGSIAAGTKTRVDPVVDRVQAAAPTGPAPVSALGLAARTTPSPVAPAVPSSLAEVVASPAGATPAEAATSIPVAALGAASVAADPVAPVNPEKTRTAEVVAASLAPTAPGRLAPPPVAPQATHWAGSGVAHASTTPGARASFGAAPETAATPAAIPAPLAVNLATPDVAVAGSDDAAGPPALAGILSVAQAPPTTGRPVPGNRGIAGFSTATRSVPPAEAAGDPGLAGELRALLDQVRSLVVGLRGRLAAGDPSSWLLLGAVVLVAVGVARRGLRKGDDRPPSADDPDLASSWGLS